MKQTKPAPKVESEYKYKMVNGELVELTEDEIAEREQMDADYLKRQEQGDASGKSN